MDLLWLRNISKERMAILGMYGIISMLNEYKRIARDGGGIVSKKRRQITI